MNKTVNVCPHEACLNTDQILYLRFSAAINKALGRLDASVL